MNFAASFLHHLQKELFDEMGHPISTIQSINEVYPFKYKEPIIIFDILQDEEEFKEPVIRPIKEMNEIEELGFVVCSVKIAPDKKWYRFQRTMLVLYRKGSMEEKTGKKIKTLPRKAGGNYYHAEFDEANLRIRLTGPKTGPTGEGPWWDVEE